ncbi:MAG: DUF4870 domain-containing protein [Candidatus Tumulicola sp.]
MSVTQQPPSDAPFGLQPNVAAGLAYLLGLIGGIVMLVGGGTNKFVKWAAAQSIVFWGAYLIAYVVVLPVLAFVLHAFVLFLWYALWLVGVIVWIWTFVTAFQGKEVRIPVIADLTQSIFKSSL